MDEGTLIAERYRVGSVIGETELGVLLRARHVQLDELVIVKILSDRVHDPRLAARFRREARNAARVKSDHVARFIDVGTLPDGRPFLVMENLEGESLDQLIAHETLGEIDAVDWILDACEALAAAHAVGIVHRELRTSSLFVTTAPSGFRSVKVLNFGTSRVQDSTGREEDAGLTVAGLATGVPDYSAPETFIRASADTRSDIWSLGVVLFEALTGARPFVGAPEEAVRKILVDAPPSLRKLRPTVSPGLEQVIVRCLAKRPEERFPDVASLASALAPFASATGQVGVKRITGRAQITIPVPPLPTMVEPDLDDADERVSLHRVVRGGGVERITYEQMRSTPPEKPHRSRRVDILVAVAAAVAVVIAIGAIRAMRGEGGGERPVAAAPVPPPPAASLPKTEGALPQPPSSVAAVPNNAASAQDPDAAPAPPPMRRRPALAPREAKTVSPPVARPTQEGDPWGWKR